MNEHQTNLENYIHQQLQAGHTPDEIYQQLKGANWQDESIHQAFSAVQQRVVPTGFSSGQPTNDSGAQVQTPQANGQWRGRIRTGWQLFKQSLTVLDGNRYLLRYLWMTAAWAFGITLVFVAIFWAFDKALYQNSYSDNLKPLGYLFAFLDYVFIYFFINLYAAGLTANVLDIFEGQRKSYKDYMHVAWSKAPAIFVYSVIESIVGMILRYVVERIRFVGWILAWLLGTMWSLGTMFVIPIMVTQEKPKPIGSIKGSIRFFKQTWGQSITAKVTVNAPLALLNFALLGLLIITIFSMASAHILNYVTFVILIIVYFVVLIALAVLGSFANSLVNIALFYYASYQKVPPAFPAELLNKVYIKRKKRGLFGSKRPDASTT